MRTSARVKATLPACLSIRPRIKRHRSQSQRKLNVSVDSCSPFASLMPLLGTREDRIVVKAWINPSPEFVFTNSTSPARGEVFLTTSSTFGCVVISSKFSRPSFLNLRELPPPETRTMTGFQAFFVLVH